MLRCQANTIRFCVCCFYLSCCAALMGQTKAEVPAVKWPSNEMSTVEAVNAVAKATSGVIVLEAWHDMTITRRVEIPPSFPGEIVSGDADELVTNPLRAIIRKPPSVVNTARGLDHVIASHGHLKIIPGKHTNITVVGRTELLNNSEWPLNKPLRPEDLTKPLTVKAAVTLLSSSYSMLKINDGYSVFGIKRIGEEEVTLDSDLLRGGTVRDLVCALIEKGVHQGAFFLVLSMPVNHGGDNATATKFAWSVRWLYQ